MTAEEERTRLIGDIARVLREGPVPDEARAAALTFIGWLARRMPGEPVSRCDLARCTGLERVLTMSASASQTPVSGLTAEYEGPRSGPKPRAAYADESAFAGPGDEGRAPPEILGSLGELREPRPRRAR
jgi:glucose-6-phosphate dehydrogenase assembly protein OpcA